jgi:enoyl-CoA hydratase/carnithine racemase
MSDALIEFAVTGGVARITLNRPDKMNSFIAPMHAALRDALETIQNDTAIRVLVLTGAGRAFCAGQDLADEEMQFVPGEPPPDLGRVVERYYKPLVMQLNRLRVPTIAAVNGVAAGAGASIAMACDLVIASDKASFLIPFSKIGLIPDTGASWPSSCHGAGADSAQIERATSRRLGPHLGDCCRRCVRGSRHRSRRATRDHAHEGIGRDPRGYQVSG